VEAITGNKVMRVRLIRDINMATNIINGYRAHEQADNWTEWATQNRELADLLELAHKEAETWQQT
jgi:hypothetical protein